MEATEEKRLQEVDAPTLKGWMERGEVVLIDVREPAEWRAVVSVVPAAERVRRRPGCSMPESPIPTV